MTIPVEPGALEIAGEAPALIVRFVAIRVGWPRAVDAGARLTATALAERARTEAPPRDARAVLEPLARARVLDSGDVVYVRVPSG